MKLDLTRDKLGNAVYNGNGYFRAKLTLAYPLNSISTESNNRIAKQVGALLEFEYQKELIAERYFQNMRGTCYHVTSWADNKVTAEAYDDFDQLRTAPFTEGDFLKGFLLGHYTWATRREWYVKAPVGGDDTLMAMSLAMRSQRKPNPPIQQYKVVKNAHKPAVEVDNTIEMELLYKVMQTPEYLQAVIADQQLRHGPNVTKFLHDTFGEGLANTYQRLTEARLPLGHDFITLDSPVARSRGYGPSGAIYTQQQGMGSISSIQTSPHPESLYEALYGKDDKPTLSHRPATDSSQGDFAILPQPTDMKKPPVTEIKVLHSDEHAKFVDECNKLLNQGYQPRGPMDVSRISGSVYTNFAQQFVKRG